MDAAAIVKAIVGLPTWLVLIILILVFIGGMTYLLTPIIKQLMEKQLDAINKIEENVDKKVDTINTRINSLEDNMLHNQRASDINDFILMLQKVTYLQSKAIELGYCTESCILEYSDLIDRVNELHNKYKDSYPLGYDESLLRVHTRDKQIQAMILAGKVKDGNLTSGNNNPLSCEKQHR